MEKTVCDDNMHKLGKFELSLDGKFVTRGCKCCSYKSTLPMNEDLTKELIEQKTTEGLINFILKDSSEIINSSDDLMRSVNVLVDNLGYILDEAFDPKELIVEISKLNNYYNKEDLERYELVNEATEFVDLYFKHEKLEIMDGRNSLTDLEVDNFYDWGIELSTFLNKCLDSIYDRKKGPSVNR